MSKDFFQPKNTDYAMSLYDEKLESQFVDLVTRRKIQCLEAENRRLKIRTSEMSIEVTEMKEKLKRTKESMASQEQCSVLNVRHVSELQTELEKARVEIVRLRQENEKLKNEKVQRNLEENKKIEGEMKACMIFSSQESLNSDELSSASDQPEMSPEEILEFVKWDLTKLI
ncbi:hypothetical protein ACOME3_004682 [Neoechinorhynchus agilis]